MTCIYNLKPNRKCDTTEKTEIRKCFGHNSESNCRLYLSKKKENILAKNKLIDNVKTVVPQTYDATQLFEIKVLFLK